MAALDRAIVVAQVRHWLSRVTHDNNKTIDLDVLRSFIDYKHKQDAVTLIKKVLKEGEDWMRVEDTNRGACDFFLTSNAAIHFLMASRKPKSEIIRQVFIDEQKTLENLRQQVLSGEVMIAVVQHSESLPDWCFVGSEHARNRRWICASESVDVLHHVVFVVVGT